MSVVSDICDRVSILDEGTVVETGKVEDILTSPASSAGKYLVFPQEAFREYEEVRDNA